MMSKKINLIVAFDEQQGIGLNNDLPWRLSCDLKRFKLLTKGQGDNGVVMGKNTWLSLPKKPLPERCNIIISKSLELATSELAANKVEIETNLNFLEKFKNGQKYQALNTLWIIGGADIYLQTLPLVDEIYTTEIAALFKVDRYFPEFKKDFVEVSREEFIEGELQGFYKRYLSKAVL